MFQSLAIEADPLAMHIVQPAASVDIEDLSVKDRQKALLYYNTK